MSTLFFLFEVTFFLALCFWISDVDNGGSEKGGRGLFGMAAGMGAVVRSVRKQYAPRWKGPTKAFADRYARTRAVLVEGPESDKDLEPKVEHLSKAAPRWKRSFDDGKWR